MIRAQKRILHILGCLIPIVQGNLLYLVRLYLIRCLDGVRLQ